MYVICSTCLMGSHNSTPLNSEGIISLKQRPLTQCKSLFCAQQMIAFKSPKYSHIEHGFQYHDQGCISAKLNRLKPMFFYMFLGRSFSLYTSTKIPFSENIAISLQSNLVQRKCTLIWAIKVTSTQVVQYQLESQQLFFL